MTAILIAYDGWVFEAMSREELAKVRVMHSDELLTALSLAANRTPKRLRAPAAFCTLLNITFCPLW